MQMSVIPGPVFTGGDSCYEGRGFKSQQHPILDGHFHNTLL